MSDASPSAEVRSPWSPLLRAVVSLVIGLHLLGVMVAPITVPPRFEGEPSIIGAKLKEVYLPYMTALYLDHSYKFFAPNPGDSHLLRYDLYFADGAKQVNRDDQILPDRFHHWPRLLYHRHFMLTEFVNDFAPPQVWLNQTLQRTTPPGSPGAAGSASAPTSTTAEAPTTPTPNQQVELVPATPQAEQGGPPPFVKTYLDGIARYLAKRHGATRVDLYYRKHLLPTSADFKRVGGRLDSPESYLDRLVASYSTEAKP